MQKATWESEGIEYAAELTQQNIEDLRAILEWNRDHNIGFYRCSSILVPWNSQFELTELPNYEYVREVARECGTIIQEADMRFSFHPDFWCKLASESADVVDRSVESVAHHGGWLDLLGLERSPRYPINIHIGAHYGDKSATADRFCEVIRDLPPRARERLVVENDDAGSLWSVPELVEQVSDRVGIPVTFDYHHHSFADRGLTYREAFEMATDTWGTVRPIAHYSEPAKLHGDSDADPPDHADRVSAVPEWLRKRADVMIESHQKERSVLNFDPRKYE